MRRCSGGSSRRAHNTEARDRIALGDALVDQRRKPRLEADDARARLAEAKTELEALQYAEERAARELDQLPRRHQDKWLEEATRDLGKARDAYRAAIVELARARDQLSDEATLLSFLQYGVQAQPIPAALGRPLSDGSTQAILFDELTALMLGEANSAEEAARVDPARPQPEPRLHLRHRV